MSPCTPQKPDDLLNITATTTSGFYIFGYHDFHVQPLRVANIFHRSIAGRNEDFVLGVLSVLLIALLTEIFQVILMRTRRRRVTRSGFHAAYVLDHVTHFRNVCTLVRRRPSHTDTRSGRSVSRNVMWSSVVILTVGVTLLAAEVFAVYLTQPFKVYAPRDSYNLVGIQPVITSLETAAEVDKATTKKRCVTPMMPHSNQTRQYSIVACVNRKEGSTMSRSASTFVEMTSLYHKAGSDHIVRYGNDNQQGEHTLQTRASIMQSELGSSSGILFRYVDEDDSRKLKYVQKMALERAILESCRTIQGAKCDELRNHCHEEYSEEVVQSVTFWEATKDSGVDVPITGNVRGIKTRFRIRLKSPGDVLRTSLSVFATSAAIEEVRGFGQYVTMPGGEEIHSIEKLVSEEARIAGVVLLGMVLLVMLALVVMLRVVLKPMSLAQIAKEWFDDKKEGGYVDDVDDDDFMEQGFGEGKLGEGNGWYERDIVEADLADYSRRKPSFNVAYIVPPSPAFWMPDEPGPPLRH